MQYEHHGSYYESEQLLRETVSITQRTIDPNSWDALAPHIALARFLHRRGRDDEALYLARNALSQAALGSIARQRLEMLVSEIDSGSDNKQ